MSLLQFCDCATRAMNSGESASDRTISITFKRLPYRPSLSKYESTALKIQETVRINVDNERPLIGVTDQYSVVHPHKIVCQELEQGKLQAVIHRTIGDQLVASIPLSSFHHTQFS